ncbi:hypothetical protein MMPV_000052 [Pyropia vietnamensis]
MPPTPRRCASVPCLATLHVDAGSDSGSFASDSPTAARGASVGSPRAVLFSQSAFAPAAAAAGERALRLTGVPHRSASAVCLTALAGPPPSPRSGHRQQRSHLRPLSGLKPGDLGWAAVARRGACPRVSPPASPAVASTGGAPLDPLVLFHEAPAGERDDAARVASGGGGGVSRDGDGGGGGGGWETPQHKLDRSAALRFAGTPPCVPAGAANSIMSATGMATSDGGEETTTSDDAGPSATRGVEGDAAGQVVSKDKGECNRNRRSFVAAVTMAVSLLGLPSRAAGVTELLASISLRGPLAARHPLFAGLSLAGDVASEALGNISCPPDGAGGLFHDCAPHSMAMLIHLIVNVLNLSPY